MHHPATICQENKLDIDRDNEQRQTSIPVLQFTNLNQLIDSKKQKQLARKGWVVTTAADFLDLTSEESAYIELKLLLSQSLRERRKVRQLSQGVVAESIGASQLSVSKTAQTDPAVSLDLLVRSLLSLGVTPEEIGQIFMDSRLLSINE